MASSKIPGGVGGTSAPVTAVSARNTRSAISSGGAEAISGRAGNVVSYSHRPDLQTIEFQELLRHVEVHLVATVVPVQLQHTGNAVSGTNCFLTVTHARPREDVSNGTRVKQAIANIAEKNR